jgi:hypothetical protein
MFRHELNSGVKQDIPVIFPNQLVHKSMAKWLIHALRRESDIDAEVVSAGFMNAEGTCHGESETLGVKSRPEDTNIIRFYDYSCGLTSQDEEAVTL